MKHRLKIRCNLYHLNWSRCHFSLSILDLILFHCCLCSLFFILLLPEIAQCECDGSLCLGVFAFRFVSDDLFVKSEKESLSKHFKEWNELLEMIFFLLEMYSLLRMDEFILLCSLIFSYAFNSWVKFILILYWATDLTCICLNRSVWKRKRREREREKHPTVGKVF